MVWVHGPEGAKVKVKAMVTERVGTRRRLHALPLRRPLPGRGPAGKYPEGGRPLRARRSVPTRRFTYGYDSVTQMQETKCTLCRIEPA